MLKEYKTVSEIYGPLMLVEGVEQAKYGHIVDIELGDGSIRHGQILQVENDKVLVQVFEGTEGINVRDSSVRFLGKPMELAVSKDVLGRVFSPRTAGRLFCLKSDSISTVTLSIPMHGIIQMNLFRPGSARLTVLIRWFAARNCRYFPVRVCRMMK
jgi:F0F1-type ATP synthase alpha subunit